MTKKSNVYTKTGDKGMTSLVGGRRVEKTHARLEAYGTVDELNSQIGVLITYVEDEKDKAFLTGIQCKLFVVGSYLATDTEHTQLRQQSVVTAEMVEELEHTIDEMDAQLPPLRLFVLPGGTRGASVCHVCRTVCRRAERCILVLGKTVDIDENVTAFVNRLSDYLFILSRKMNIVAGQEEIIWKRTCK
ncbi:MAG: cob(I)yrinic acid a,c-diamide adenosyltransferase [Bacteroides sp.]|nr:cob(I)yrinic acid a,c-diamide adenosyltransferase [Roseburia sp.]MCM1345677.1 cob(I)yrinic acid a,c-diamide adenosyltransferase [Bacteroides sp.]MCM1420440.1 cob(I)yrinic acid a,c-diamide adenosyltransferase [Bacteroides sp.]